jgi:polysaccharide export outer membrane protein
MTVAQMHSPHAIANPRGTRRSMHIFAKSAFVGAFALFGGMGEAFAEYRIQSGDILEFSVASLPNLKQRVAVDINGEVNFPLLQDLSAAGLPLPELRTKVRELISAKPFRQRDSEGHETLLTIDPDEITISIVEYRPIYISGDVARPGEQPFRPGITVRQAIALGGGADQTDTKGGVALQSIDNRDEYRTLSADQLLNRAVIDRLSAELGERTSIPDEPVASAPLDQTTQRAFIDRETKLLTTSVTDYQKQKQFIKQSVSQADHFLTVLGAQQQNEKQSADLDAQDFQRMTELYGKGEVAVTRVADSRRALLLSATRQLQTSVQVEEGQIRKDGLGRSLDALDSDRNVKLLHELQDAQLKSVELQSKLRALSEKIAFNGRLSQVANKDDSREIRIFRKGQNDVVANDDSELQPGDVVQVTIRDNLFASVPSN